MNGQMQTVEYIQHHVAGTFGFRRLDLIGERRRDKRLVAARWTAMYLAEKFTTYSRARIGRCFKRDHTTVKHALDTLPSWLAKDPDLQETLTRLEYELAPMAESESAGDVA